MNKILDYLTIQQAAIFLGVAPNTLRNWERAKKIIAYRNPLNHYRLYKKEDLEQLLKNIKPAQ
jgi:DNA (cytosine-5)-methyltransferase 1